MLRTCLAKQIRGAYLKDSIFWEGYIQGPFVCVVDRILGQDISIRMQHSDFQKRWQTEAASDRLNLDGLSLRACNRIKIRLSRFRKSTCDTHRDRQWRILG